MKHGGAVSLSDDYDIKMVNCSRCFQSVDIKMVKRICEEFEKIKFPT